MKLPVYLDYSATTPVDPRVAEKMIPYLTEFFGNAASRSHAFGWKAEEAVEQARSHVAALINADPKEIVWTSGATEGNNLAIKGAALFYKTKGKHIITQKTEHKAVLDTCRDLERHGFEVTYLDVEQNGIVSLERFEAAIRPDTILASIMMVNNEIGVIQPVGQSAEICKKKGVIYHCDAVQAGGRIEIDMQKFKADLLTLDAYPHPSRIPAFYGQSASITAFLAQRDNPARFLEFLRQAQLGGYDEALRAVYGIANLGELERLWYAERRTWHDGYHGVALALDR